MLDVEQRRHERLEPLDRQVHHVAPRDDDVADRWRGPEVVEHQVPSFLLLRLEPVLQPLRRVVADQVHARAVAAVLRAGLEQLRQDFRGVAVGEALHRPHVALVQRVPLREGMARPFGIAVGERGDHVATHAVAPEVALIHGVQHLGGKEHRHGGPLALVALDVGGQVLGEEGTEGVLQLGQVLHGVGPLPLGALPLLGRDVPVAGQATPVGLHELPSEWVHERLRRGVGRSLTVSRSHSLHRHGPSSQNHRLKPYVTE